MAESPSTKKKRKKTKPKSRKKPVHETAEHAKLKDALKEIARTGGFKFDTEIVLNFTGNRDSNKRLLAERSIDFAAYTSSSGRASLLIFECKSGADLRDVNKTITAWEADIAKIKQGKGTIISSHENALQTSDLGKFEEIRICYVFAREMEPDTYERLAKALRARGLYAWDSTALSYYRKTANTIGKAAKYQLLREFEVTLDSDGLYEEQAIRLTQGKVEMFLLGAKPKALIKIGYVYRRASGKPSAYQRIVSGERIKRISMFLRSRNALLPNAIIIAFDDESYVQKRISYEEGRLCFPRRYCCAWIIDGQHRVFGFLGTKHGADEEDAEPAFKLPVVAFRRMDLLTQNRTFVSINYNQKKIDPTLLCDLATELPDLNNELTWPSLLVAGLNRVEPFKDRVKISELHSGRPVTITSFARFALLESLLGFDRKTRFYRGPLNAYAPVHPRASVNSSRNRASMKRQLALLQRYFAAVHVNTSRPDPKKDPWLNTNRYSLLKATGINAFLLVLSRLMERYPHLENDMHQDLQTYLRPLKRVTFTRAFVAKQGGGWKGFRLAFSCVLKASAASS